MTCKAKVIGTGSYLPTNVLTNRQLEQMVETTDEWIVTRTGIQERRIAEAHESSSTMGAQAALRALENANLPPSDIDYILVATITPDFVFPSTACLIQKEIGAKKAAAIDIQGACTGFLYGLSLAKALVETKQYKNILVVATDKLSSITDYKDRTTCVLFGDGASAAVVSLHGNGLTIESVQLGADGELSELIAMPAGGCRSPASQETVDGRQHFIKMSGNEVFKHAVRRMESASKECLETLGLQELEISWIIPHQANSRIIDAIAKRFEHLPDERIFKTVHKYGNTSGSSIGIALDELLRNHPVQWKEKLLLTAFGAGLTWGAAVLQVERGESP